MPEFSTKPLTPSDIDALQPGDSVRWLLSNGYYLDKHQVYKVIGKDGYVLTVESKNGEYEVNGSHFALAEPLTPPHTMELAALLGVKL